MELTLKHILVAFVLVIPFAGCSHNQVPPSVVDIHTSRNSLDWTGEYSGILACTNCPGITTKLTLRSDDTYQLRTGSVGGEAALVTTHGQIIWHLSGNVISLEFEGTTRQFAVNEGRLVLLNLDGTRPDPLLEKHLLNRVGDIEDPSSTTAQVLEDHLWTVESALDERGKKLLPLSPANRPGFMLTFSEGNFSARGGCNSLRGSYEVTADSTSSKLVVGKIASTMMACEPEAQEADAMLSAFLAAPLQISVTADKQPVLRMTSTKNHVLKLRGTATPESLYGAGTTMFLEVAPQLVACQHAGTIGGQCLHVRNRYFDKQGLKLEARGEWRPLPGGIEGYEHTAGQRDIARVKRYQCSGDRSSDNKNPCTDLYVLEFVVQSETVSP